MKLEIDKAVNRIDYNSKDNYDKTETKYSFIQFKVNLINTKYSIKPRL